MELSPNLADIFRRAWMSRKLSLAFLNHVEASWKVENPSDFSRVENEAIAPRPTVVRGWELRWTPGFKFKFEISVLKQES